MASQLPTTRLIFQMCVLNTRHHVFMHKKCHRNAAQPEISLETKGEGQICDISSLFTAGLLSISFKQLIRGTFHTSLFSFSFAAVIMYSPSSPPKPFSFEPVLKFLLSQMSSDHLSTISSALLPPSVLHSSVSFPCSSPWTNISPPTHSTTSAF